MSPGVVQVRKDICGDCSTPCAWQRDGITHANACAACPIRKWAKWGNCKESSPSPSTSSLTALGGVTALLGMRESQWWRRKRGLVSSGILAPSLTRHSRAKVCAGCQWVKKTGKLGMFRCGHFSVSCGCGGGNEPDLSTTRAKCPLSLW